MEEFGSDFHLCEINHHTSHNFFNNNIRYYACGRHAIDTIVHHMEWNRMWIPAYFCYEVIEHIKRIGIKIKFYDDHPLSKDDNALVKNLPYENGDVLLRMNYFGLRHKRSNQGIPVPVIEDHSHDLISDWALHSDADWCIASLRKTLPIAAGGILWSPIGKELPKQIESTSLCEQMASIRYDAMCMKRDYLFKSIGDKHFFREKYIQSENMLAHLPMSGIDKKSLEVIQAMDIEWWTHQKCENWHTAISIISRHISVLETFDKNNLHPFSLVLLCKSFDERIKLRQYLIDNCIYPAVLWQIPDNSYFIDALDFSKKMLSIHCDARYNQKQIRRMCDIIIEFFWKNN